MDSLREHFRTLGLSEKANLEDALASYKDLIRVWHPDRFGHDPRLRKKAEEQTSRINVSMAAVRGYFKDPSAYRRAAPSESSHGRSHAAPPPIQPSLGMKLAVHQRRWISTVRALSGLLLLHLGWWLSITHPGSPGQIALGVVMCGYGFSIALLGITLLCFKRPIISVTHSSIRILGWPTMPIAEIAAAHLVVTTKGSVFTLQTSPYYLKRTPTPLNLWLHAHLLVRRNHYEVRASTIDTHPALIIDTLDRITARGATPPPPHLPPPSAWAYYASLFSIVTLAIPVTRILLEGPLPPASILPYLMLFALLQTSSVVKTVVLAPTR